METCRILILGAGGIGGYFGARLAGAGIDVTFLVRPRRAAELARQGLVVRSPLGDARLVVTTTDRADHRYDVVVIACKAYDLDAAIDAVHPAVGPDTVVLPLLNGVRHLDVLDARLPEAQVLGGLCHIGVAVTPEGDIQHLNQIQHLALGPRTPAQKPPSEALHAVLSAGGFAPVLSASILQEMWEKFVFIASYAGITTLFRAPIGTIARVGGATIASGLLDECAAIATASGFPPGAAFMAQSRATLTDMASTGTASMLRDMQRGARTEQDHILGDMAARATSCAIAAPILRIAHTNLLAYEAALATSRP